MDIRLRKGEWHVEEVAIPVARKIVETHHYARGAANTATFLHGLFHIGSPDCWGVAWWIPPTKGAALATFPENWQGVLCLSRLVVLPETPKNACTFLLSRSRHLIDPVRWPCLVTYADDWQQHTGGIYRADNWEYRGKTKPERTYVINGRMVSRKAGGNTRTHAEMLALGAVCVGSFSKHKYVKVRS